MANVYTLTNRRTGQVVAAEVVLASSFWRRLRGLIGHGPLRPGEGLWLKPCRQVHMLGMRFALSVWFLDHTGTVCAIVDNLKPGQISPRLREAASVLEFPAGWALHTGVRSGDKLTWFPNNRRGCPSSS